MPRQLMHRRSLAWLSFAVAAASACPSTFAAVSTLQTQQPVANFAFASQLGAGVYSVDGRAVQIYRLPFEWELRPPTQERVGLDLTLPVTLGFYSYRVQDVVTEGLPKTVDTYSFLPGLEVSRLFGPRWRLAAFAELGVATAYADTNKSLIYDGGARARYDFQLGEAHLRYGAEILYAVSQVRHETKDTMVRLTNGLDARFRTSMSLRGETVDYGPYALSEWYPKRPTVPASSSGQPIAAAQWELGVTVGTVNTAYLCMASICKVPLPRIGLGYRFGEGLSIFRLVFGSAF
jgi:hypothetical protein